MCVFSCQSNYSLDAFLVRRVTCWQSFHRNGGIEMSPTLTAGIRRSEHSFSNVIHISRSARWVWPIESLADPAFRI